MPKETTKDEQTSKPLTPEQRAFQNANATTVNTLENPYATGMTLAKAEEVIKHYVDFKGNEVPNDLAQARKIFNIQ